MQVSLAGRRLDRRRRLRLPVEQFRRDCVVAIHRRRRVVVLGLLERDEEQVAVRRRVEVDALAQRFRRSNVIRPNAARISSSDARECTANGTRCATACDRPAAQGRVGLVFEHSKSSLSSVAKAGCWRSLPIDSRSDAIVGRAPDSEMQSHQRAARRAARIEIFI